VSNAGSGGRVLPARPGDPVRVGPYRIIGRLGSGGMGTVHAGLDPAGTRVAVKIVHAAQAQDPEFRARFRREVRLSARVEGPCLIPLLGADTEAESPWLATAYAPGPTLGGHLAAHGPLTGGTLYAFATGTAQALAAIHAAGVVHRDVKPQNVILTPAGPRVLDFGIAHSADVASVTRTGMMTGTPGWISPEHYRTGTAGTAGDVFAWGALVAYAATGRLPFGNGAPDVVAYRIMSGEPDLAGLPEGLRPVVERALAKEAGERPSAVEAAEVCTRLLAGEATRVLPAGGVPEPTLVGALISAEWDVPSVADPSWPLPVAAPLAAPRRRRALMLAAVAVAGAAVAGAVYALGPLDSRGADAGGGTGGAAKGTGAVTSPSPSARTSGGRPAASPAAATPSAPADPRTVRIPVDPLAGVPAPAYTASGDQEQPGAARWRESTVADGPAETAVAAAVRARLAAALATKDLSLPETSVTFGRRSQTVFVTGGPVSQLPDGHREVFDRAAAMAACAELAHRLKDDPAGWPYGRWAVVRKTHDGDTEPGVIGYGEATRGCHNEVAGTWQGSQEGMRAAGIPSADRSEIRVADATVKAVLADWNANTDGMGDSPLTPADGIQLGFDPVEQAAYVWSDDPAGRFAGRAQQSNLAHIVERTVCARLRAEFRSDRQWTYTRWALAVRDPFGDERRFIRAGTCAT
jgi:eukaryotic-like serine/threonine-protein kinase